MHFMDKWYVINFKRESLGILATNKLSTDVVFIKGQRKLVTSISKEYFVCTVGLNLFVFLCTVDSIVKCVRVY